MQRIIKRKITVPFSSKDVLPLYLGGVRLFGFKNPAHMHHFDCKNNILQTTCAAI
jgi:hypothetical protein